MAKIYRSEKLNFTKKNVWEKKGNWIVKWYFNSSLMLLLHCMHCECLWFISFWSISFSQQHLLSLSFVFTQCFPIKYYYWQNMTATDIDTHIKWMKMVAFVKWMCTQHEVVANFFQPQLFYDIYTLTPIL